MWRIGRPQTHFGGLSRWTGQLGPRHLARTHEDPGLTIVSASVPGPEWDVESDVGSTGPAPGWMAVRRTDCEGTRMRDHVLLCRLGLARVTTAQREM